MYFAILHLLGATTAHTEIVRSIRAQVNGIVVGSHVPQD